MLLMVVVGRGGELLRANVGLASADSAELTHYKSAHSNSMNQVRGLILKAWHVFRKLNLRGK
jgi:hypothetical protein